MAFEKWFYRNAPGSPGHTARTLVEWYHKEKAMFAQTIPIDSKGIYLSLFMRRLTIQETFNNKGSLLRSFGNKINSIIIENDMPLFVFAIESLETIQFRKNLYNENIDIVLEVVREEVQKKDATLINLTFSDYRYKAFEFFNFVIDYTKENNIQ